MSHISSFIGTLDHQGLVLLGGVMEPLGGGALLEEAHHEGWTLTVYKYPPSHSASWVNENVISLLPALVTISAFHCALCSSVDSIPREP